MVAVYGILCLANRKMYIGQSTNVKQRWAHHKNQLKNNKHYAKRLQKAWNRYGQKMFRLLIIEQASKQNVYKRELYWIKTLKTYKPENGFNRHWSECQ